jgi:Protein of unknown function (DUF3097)
MAEPDRGILNGLPDLDGPRRVRETYPVVEASEGRIVEHRASGLVGFIVRANSGVVVLRDRQGRECPVRLLPGGFVIEGRVVTLVPPRAATADAPSITASGSVAVDHAPRVAQASRILVEGVHDAELIEKVWGDDLRAEGVVVERLDGLDHLPEAVLDFRPGPGRRLGVLVDHLVDGTKEWRIAHALTSPYVLVAGTPYVDVWEAVKPSLIGLSSWPTIPRDVPWKEGVCRVLGEREPASLWRRLLASVQSYTDLEPPLVGAVEELIDFITASD